MGAGVSLTRAFHCFDTLRPVDLSETTNGPSPFNWQEKIPGGTVSWLGTTTTAGRLWSLSQVGRLFSLNFACSQTGVPSSFSQIGARNPPSFPLKDWHSMPPPSFIGWNLIRCLLNRIVTRNRDCP